MVKAMEKAMVKVMSFGVLSLLMVHSLKNLEQ